ncbi:2-oxo-4-hydroxy-4-carboxy-5-ureidoimidazoline decarboxylase [Variovorax sp. PCZ-1]|uniref:2-oxo-4-hydroxy-4-carboxy-5-ureidoimidazoline decarboxylase n=1 Tax=Variovorax sp. PCZ-1 TaxID=2835533 RepID=UPI001BCB0CAD|nr:2-oxo-4-hydroxy-4-carboxy-5-ureidoimidazoline decarboxylase [Variovorax sp. PCZ-1]MBS7808930.1 2-oxo-4-hydroxy-4-carboxy-5-ureidoimidazoline decarboxylase [Variovorax sp. PCZ-1]
MTLTLQQLNAASQDEATALLDGTYEHSAWIAHAAMAQRPFTTLAALKYAMAQVVAQASREQQLGLIRAHPELAGKAMVSQSLTAESTHEQSKAGLTNCSAEEFAKLQKLNADYNAKFGWPFILAVRGPRGLGLTRQQIIATFERRLHGHPDFELVECLRNIHRIAEIRLNDKFATQPDLGSELWDWHESLSAHSDPGFKENGQLTVTYMTDAHKACAQEIAARMRECGFDSVEIDVLGNVVGCYESDSASRSIHAVEMPKTLEKSAKKSLLTGSHYDTVRNGGKYDGRLGFFTPMMCVRELHKTGRRLPFGIEVVAFSEEEGQRYKATFLASGALTGHFNPAWLEQADSDGILMKNMLFAGTESAQDAMNKIAFLKRDPTNYLGFVEVHIEQGPVLNAMNLPLGVVTSINGSVRYLGEIIGQASHAGTTPMATRRDAAAALAELSVYMESRAAKDGDSVATIGMLNVPNGSINVVPGKCSFSLDLRAPTDAQRDALVNDVIAQLKSICERRAVSYTLEETMRVAAAPSDAAWQARWTKAVQATGLPIFTMPSGAGHDAMKLHEIMPQAMLFVRGENSGISHNPLESTTQDDMQLGIDAFMQLLNNLAQEKDQ